ncbi:hypothetical protein AXF24_12325 [Streptococcus pneumoniae]|nr:hypothetical protein AWW74_12345 [Streptococcus pneumoniae]KXB94863.1 hypothetical protein AXF24_12325 [Streptococcus pneumoniae]
MVMSATNEDSSVMPEALNAFVTALLILLVEPSTASHRRFQEIRALFAQPAVGGTWRCSRNEAEIDEI